MSGPSLKTVEFKRGPGGRPTRAEAARRHAVLLETAARLFIDRGLDVVSIDEIARRAGVAKRFIYGRYGDKSQLFVAAIEHYVAGRLEALHDFTPLRRDAEQGLVAFGRKLIDLALHPDTLALQRLFISAAPRFPELIERFIVRNRHRSIGEIERVLRFYAERGEIELAPAQLTAEQFFIAIVGIPQRLALVGQRDPAPAEARRLRAAVRLFLDGCRTRRGT